MLLVANCICSLNHASGSTELPLIMSVIVLVATDELADCVCAIVKSPHVTSTEMRSPLIL